MTIQIYKIYAVNNQKKTKKEKHEHEKGWNACERVHTHTQVNL